MTNSDPVAPHAKRASNWRRYLQFWGSRVESDVDDELTLHLELRARDYMARGMTETQARAAAASRIGDLESARQQCLTIGRRRHRRMTRTHMMDALRQDLRFALRMLGRQKAWAAVAIVTLALGIGASAAVFSVMDSVVRHPYPYRDADRLYTIWLSDSTQAMMTSPSRDQVEAWQAGTHSFDGIEAYEEGTVTLSGSGDATMLNAVWMQRDLPAFAGIPLVRGRTFTVSEAADSGSHVAIISEGLWRQRFGGGDVLGTRINLNQTPYTIVGIAPSTLRLPTVMAPGPTDVWLPRDRKGLGITNAIARLLPNATIPTAQNDLAAVLSHAALRTQSASDRFIPKLVPPSAMSDLTSSAKLLSVGVVLLLAIACVNLAHLLLARGASRERELSIRRALGAGNGRMTRQLFTETLLLALAGCAAGVAFGKLGLSLMLALRPARLRELAYTRMNGTVLWGAAAVSLATALVFALIGSRASRQRATAESLKGTATAGTGTRKHNRVRAALVITEMALSAALLMGAVLLIRSINKLQQIDPGFDTHDLYTMNFEPPQNRYRSTEQIQALITNLETRARGLSGVRAATIARSAPPHIIQMLGAMQARGQQARTSGSQFTSMNTVYPDYFSVLRMPVRRGRNFDQESYVRNEAIINESMAHQLWPGRDALGEQFRLAPPSGMPLPAPWYTVVGVVPNTLGLALDDGTDHPMAYASASATHNQFWNFTLIVRASPGVNPSAALRRVSLSADPAMAPPAVTTMDSAISETIAARRFTMVLLTIFAAVAVALAAVGLYGVISYAVAQQTREIGIRMALGALPARVARAVLVRGVLLCSTGLAIGLAGSFWGTRVIRSSLYGVGTTDALSYALVIALLLGLSALACLVPTRRAMRVDPLIAMRAE